MLFYRDNLTFGLTTVITIGMTLLGEYLRHAREERGISPLQVEIDTRVRATVIEALEAGDFARLPPEPFLRGLVRTYAHYLGADSQAALKFLIADLTAPPPPKLVPIPPAPPPPRSKTPPRSFRFPALISKPTQPDSKIETESVPVIEPPAIEENFFEPSPPAMPPPPEKLQVGTFFPQNQPPSILRDLAARIPLPVPAIIGIGIVIIVIVGTCGLLAMSQLSAAVSNATRRTPTITRALPTVTLPIVPGALTTPVPTLAITALPFATFPGNATATRRIPTRRPLDTSNPLNLDIDANEAIKIVIGVDGVQVFAGAMDASTSRSWSAKSSLYFRVENAKGAEIFFNGKQVLAAVFAERALMERQWNVNKGTPASARPTPPKPQTAIPTPTTTPTPTLEKQTEVPTPTPTRTPF